MTTLKQEFEFYLANKGEFLKKYDGKFIVIVDGKVIGVYDDQLEAITETSKLHPPGTFLVQHVSDTGGHARFHSRVSF